MSAKLINNGVALIYQPIADVQKGTIVQLGSVIGVVNQKILANTQGSIIIGKYWSCSRKSGAVFSAGDRAYVDLITQEITDDPSDIFVGVYISDNILSSDFVNIKFNEYFGLDDDTDFLEYANLAAFPVTGVLNTIYVAIDTNKTYRWTGSVYVEISAGGASVASAVAFTPTGNISATDVQAALAELDTEKQPIDADLTAIAGLVGVHGDIIYRNASQWQRLPAGTAGRVLQTNGAGADPSWVVPSGGASRADASLAVLSSAGFSVDMITAQNLIITMDAVFGGSGLKPAVNPTVDGQVLEITFKKGGTIFQPVLDPAYFTDTGLDVTLPSPLLNATINTEDDFRFKWSNTIGKYKCVGFSRRYS